MTLYPVLKWLSMCQLYGFFFFLFNDVSLFECFCVDDMSAERAVVGLPSGSVDPSAGR